MRTVVAAALLLAMIFGACTGDDDEPPADDAATATSAPDDADGDDEDAAADPAATPEDGELAARYVDAGGSGVAIRSECEDAARTGDAWPDGIEVTVVRVGTGQCDGWSLVFAGSGSWVRNEYLSDTAPAGFVARPPTGGGSSGGSGSTSQPSSGGGGSQPAPQPTTATAAPLEFTSLQGVAMTSNDLLGGATLRGGSSGFLALGTISNSRTLPKSVCNPTGTYGSKTSDVSVRNPEGEFGIAYTGDIYHPHFNSAYSAYNAQATNPPSIVLDDVIVAHLSANGATGSIHPDTLFFHLGCSY